MTYSIVPERSHDGSWWAIAPDLPGLLMYGASRQDLIASAADAIAQYVAAMRADSCPVAPPATYSIAPTAGQGSPIPIVVSLA